MVEKSNFLRVVETPHPKNWFFFHFEVVFRNVWIFPRARVAICCEYTPTRVFQWKDELSGWFEQKFIYFLAKTTDFGHFWLPRSTFKINFLNVQENFGKSLVRFLGEVVWNLACEISIYSGLRGVAILQVDIFQNPWF